MSLPVSLFYHFCGLYVKFRSLRGHGRWASLLKLLSRTLHRLEDCSLQMDFSVVYQMLTLNQYGFIPWNWQFIPWWLVRKCPPQIRALLMPAHVPDCACIALGVHEQRQHNFQHSSGPYCLPPNLGLGA
jgi:hypothetical protein